jgi:hypothetical protein
MSSPFPRLVLAEPGSSAAPRLGHRLVDAYLELVAARLRANSTLGIAYDLKVFFTVIDKDPLEVRRADIVSFVREQRTSRDGTNVVRLTDGSSCKCCSAAQKFPSSDEQLCGATLEGLVRCR